MLGLFYIQKWWHLPSEGHLIPSIVTSNVWGTLTGPCCEGTGAQRRGCNHSTMKQRVMLPPQLNIAMNGRRSTLQVCFFGK